MRLHPSAIRFLRSLLVFFIVFLITSKFQFTGVLSGGCGDNAVRLRPALTMQPKHAHIFLDKLKQVLDEGKI